MEIGVSEVFLSWVELELIFRRLEIITPLPKEIKLERRNIDDKTKTYNVSVRSHYRYKDFSILNAVCTSE
jgi:hypothetical protein